MSVQPNYKSAFPSHNYFKPEIMTYKLNLKDKEFTEGLHRVNIFFKNK